MKIFKINDKFNNVITTTEIDKWQGNNVILDGATGSGKSYFILHKLQEYAGSNIQNILFLCNRVALHKDIQDLIYTDSINNIEPITYQALQSKLKKGEPIKQYDYIVCDEFHYIFSDANFNLYTDLTYNWLINQPATKIFLSGTGNRIFTKLKADGIVKDDYIYKIPYNYNYVTDLFYYSKKDEVYNIINNVLENTDDKIIYFANSLNDALDVYLQFQDYAHFRCSKNTKNKECLKCNEPDCINTYCKNLITFKKRLLVTTKVLDNGINIVDKQVKHIVSDIFDYESSQQCLGRKRKIDNTDTVTFYIHNYSKKAIRNFEWCICQTYNPIKLFIKSQEEYNKTYDKNREYHNKYIFNIDADTRDYNHLAFESFKYQLEDIKAMQKADYITEFYIRLGDTMIIPKELNRLAKYKKKDNLELYLKSIVEKMLFKEEQEELINKIDHKINGKQKRSLKSLNIALKINKLNYTIISKKDNRRKLESGEDNPNRDKKYWQVIDGKTE